MPKAELGSKQAVTAPQLAPAGQCWHSLVPRMPMYEYHEYEATCETV